MGVTVDFRKRIIKHISVSNTQKGDIVHSAIRKYSEDIEFVKVCECEYDYALHIEEKLRPDPLIGWNIVRGGGRGRYGMPQTDNQKVEHRT